MKLQVKNFDRKIYVYGNEDHATGILRQIAEFGLSAAYIGNKPETLFETSAEADSLFVLALGPGERFGQVKKSLLAQSPELSDRIWRDIEFFSELASRAELLNPPVPALQEHYVLLGMNMGFVLGGIESFVAETYHRLRKDGMPVKLLETYQPRQYSEYTYVGRDFYGIASDDIVRIGPEDGDTDYPFSDYVMDIVRYIAKHPPKVFIDNCSMRSLAAVCLVRHQLKVPIRILSFIHGNVSIFFNRVLRHQQDIDHIYTVSEEIRSRTLTLLPERKADISVCRLLPAADPTALRTKRDDGFLHIAYAARLEPGNKRALWLIDVARGLRRRKIPFRLHVAGEGECLSALYAFQKNESFEKELLLYGQVAYKDMSAFYRDKHIFINFSINEGGPMTLYEAMAHALAPIVTNTGSAASLITDGQNGYFIESPDDIIDRIEHLADNPELLRTMQRESLAALEAESRRVGFRLEF